MDILKECFVICPIGSIDSNTRKRSDKLFKHILSPVAQEYEYNLVRADKMPKSGMITTQIIKMIMDAPLVIADLSDGNPNVFYELALRHASKKPYIQLIESSQNIPFDVSGVRTITYDMKDIDVVEEVKKELGKQILEFSNGHKVDSPISMAIGENIFESDSNALPVFLEKFWNIEDSVQSMIQSLDNMDTESIRKDLENFLSYDLDHKFDEFRDKVCSDLEEKIEKLLTEEQ